jgi:hypothetical protein
MGAGALTEAERQEHLAEATRRRNEWRWLRRMTLGGTLLGALTFWVIGYATGDDSGALFNRGDAAFFAAFAGAIMGAIVGFVLWALWVLSRTIRRRM